MSYLRSADGAGRSFSGVGVLFNVAATPCACGGSRDPRARRRPLLPRAARSGRRPVLRGPVDLSRSNIPVPHRAWQVLYRTADTTGRPEAAVATVIVPQVAYEGKRPLVSYQPAEDSLTRRCSSSYELRTGSGGEPDTFSMALERGWTVVVPDYEGPRSQWVAGVQAGHAVLDAIRAAKRRGSRRGPRGRPARRQPTANAAPRSRGRRPSSRARGPSRRCPAHPRIPSEVHTTRSSDGSASPPPAGKRRAGACPRTPPAERSPSRPPPPGAPSYQPCGRGPAMRDGDRDVRPRKVDRAAAQDGAGTGVGQIARRAVEAVGAGRRDLGCHRRRKDRGDD